MAGVVDLIKNYLTTKEGGSGIGMGIEGLARLQEFLADKKIPLTNKDLTDIFSLISKPPEREKFTAEDEGKVIGYGEFAEEGETKPLTISQVPAAIGSFLFEPTAKTMQKVRDEGLTFDEMSPGERLNMAAGAAEFTPLGFAPDVYRLGRAGIKTGVKAIDDLIAPVGVTDTGIPMKIDDATDMTKMEMKGTAAAIDEPLISLTENQQKLIQNLVESKPKSALNRTSKIELFNSIFSDPNLIKDPLLINKLARELNNQGLFLGKDPLKNAQTFLGRIINRAKAGELNPKLVLEPLAVENYKRIATEGMGEGAKTSLKKITKEQRQAGQAESVKIQRLNRVKKYKNLYNTMIDNNLTFDQAVTSAYKAATGKDISKATKHDQIIGAFYRNEKTLKNKNPTLHKFFENEVKAYQIGKATDRQVKYGTKEYELARQELAKTLGIDVKDIDRAHSIMKPRLAKLYNLLQEGKITRQDYERLQRPSFFLLKKQNKDHVRLENRLDSLLERKKFLMDNKNIVDANKTQVAIDKVVKEMELIGVKSELYHPIDKLLTVFGKEPSVKELQSLATKQLKNMGGLVGINHLTRPLRNFSS